MGLRTGAEYLAALRDGRQIIYDGQPLDDVTTTPGFRHTARAVAQYYDFQHLPEVRDLVTYETPDGDRVHLSFISPGPPSLASIGAFNATPGRRMPFGRPSAVKF